MQNLLFFSFLKKEYFPAGEFRSLSAALSFFLLKDWLGRWGRDREETLKLRMYRSVKSFGIQRFFSFSPKSWCLSSPKASHSKICVRSMLIIGVIYCPPSVLFCLMLCVTFLMFKSYFHHLNRNTKLSSIISRIVSWV